MRNIQKINTITLIGVLIYITTFFNTTMFDYEMIRYVLIVIVGVLLSAKMSLRILKRNLNLNFFFIVFGVMSLCISYGAQELTVRNPFYANLVFVIVLAELILYLELVNERNMIEHCCKIWYRCAFFVTLLTDVLVFTKGATDELYLVGTKFGVVYQHLFLITLFMYLKSEKLAVKNNRQRYSVQIKLALLLLLTGIVSIYVDCMTGVVGIIIFFVLSILVRKFGKIFTSPVFFLVTIFLSFSVVWAMSALLVNTHIANFITKYLNRELTLTGRTLIYAGLPFVMKEHWLLGYGYGSSYEICNKYLGFANAQNALMDWILQIGIVGTIALCFVFVICVSKMHRRVLQNGKKFRTWIWPFALIYTYIFLGTVEITYNMQFISALLLLYFIDADQNNAKN